jgi:hypothetical protein
MIQETIVTTISPEGQPHIAPMGIHVLPDEMLILPFRPSLTLDNLLATGHAVLNHTDDVRVFAGCLTGRRDWPLTQAETIPCPRLADTLSHVELELTRWEDDDVRPRFHCKVLHQINHKPFQGFNRAQNAVLEAAILASRLSRLPWEKIDAELAYLRIGLEKCAGERELEAWGWLMEKIETYRTHTTEPAP